MSVQDGVGGGASIDAALDKFYPKILGDARVSFLFEGIDMTRLRKHARAFLTMAFGGPNHYEGPDLRSAPTRARGQGLNEPLFKVFTGHFPSPLHALALPHPTIPTPD